MPHALRILLLLAVVTSSSRADLFDLYWADAGDGFDHGRVERASASGDPRATIFFAGADQPYGIDLDPIGGKVYWTDIRSKTISRSNLDGSDREVLFTGGVLSVPTGLAVDAVGGKLYWVDTNLDAVRRSNLDGSEVETLVEVSGQSNLEGIALDLVNGGMYWTDRTAGRIQRANLDGTDVETILEGGVIGQPFGIDVDPEGGKLYFADFGEGGVARANLDGSELEALLLVNEPWGLDLDLDNGLIYFTEASQFNEHPSISVANLDGSGFERIIIDDLDNPKHIAVIPEPFTLLLLTPAAMIILCRRSRR